MEGKIHALTGEISDLRHQLESKANSTEELIQRLALGATDANNLRIERDSMSLKVEELSKESEAFAAENADLKQKIDQMNVIYKTDVMTIATID